MSNYDSRQSTQGGTFVNLMRDSGFKAVYADKDNKQLLIELLNFFLPEDVKVSDIKAYLDREQDPEVESGKRTYLDLVCQGEDGSVFSVEVQQEGEKWIFERCMYYGCDIYRNQISSGDYYSELKPLYIICILGKNFSFIKKHSFFKLFSIVISIFAFNQGRLCELKFLKLQRLIL